MPGRYRERPYVPARDPLTAIPPSRHPFQFWVLTALALSGAGNFFTPGSEVLQQGLDLLAHKTWAMTLLISALLALLGAYWPDRITGLLLERIGLITIGFSCPAYALMVYAQIGVTTGVVGLTLTASMGIASLWRVIHVNRELRMLRQFVARHYQ